MYVIISHGRKIGKQFSLKNALDERFEKKKLSCAKNYLKYLILKLLFIFLDLFIKKSYL